VYSLVRQIPEGCVATYGQIAGLVEGCTPRMVGYAMAAVRDESVPWQRVINSRGTVSERSNRHGRVRQQRILESEGVAFDRSGRVDLEEFGWLPAPHGKERTARRR
jgi:methylated-DNA-protein-cysteine methyltransferase-like protein